MKFPKGLLLLFITILFSRALAQQSDTVFYLNGNVVPAKIIDTLIGFVTFTEPTDSVKRVNIDNEALFAVKYASGKMYYYYKQDTINGNWYTRDEMWAFMQGERDARKHYRSRGAFIGSMLFGLAGGMTGVLYAPVFPAAFMGATELVKVKLKPEWVSGPYLTSQVTYLLGFQREAFVKRRLTILKGGGIGLAVGFTAFALYLNKGRWIWLNN
jgi:hypothetical protein